MPGIDERLRRELERLATPADPAGAFDRVAARKARRRVVRRVYAGALAVLVVTGTAVSTYALDRVFRAGSGTIGPAGGVENGRILFADLVNQQWDLFTVEPDGTGLVNLTRTPDTNEIYASWSPDGTGIAFCADPVRGPDEENVDLYTMNADGSGLTQLTDHPGIECNPAWSPDGKRIAFVGQLDGQQLGSIYVMNADGTGVLRLTDGPDQDWTPAWSPDGERIAFARSVGRGTPEGPNVDILVVNADGSNERTLVGGPANEWFPDWSPDGAKIAFWRDAGPMGIYVADADGSDATALPTGNIEVEREPTWSPDGRKILFAGYGSDQTEALYVMDVDGTNLHEIIEIPGQGGLPDPDWQPVPAGAEPPGPGQTQASAVPSAEPTPVLKGIGPVCNLSVVEGDFSGHDAVETAFVYSRMPDAGGCQPPENGFQFLGISGPDGSVALTYGPLDCEPACRAFAAPDLDGDGRSEIAVVQLQAASTTFFGLYGVGTSGGPGSEGAAIVPIEVTEPGDPGDGFPPGPALFGWGGSVRNLAGAYCKTFSDGSRHLVAWTASANKDGTSYTLTEVYFGLEGADLEAIAAKHAPTAGLDELPDGGGADLCGAPISGSSGD